MARPLRIEYPGAFYHVMNRGHRGEPIITDVRDKQRFISCLSRMAGQFNVLVHGYCLMTNHYHLILETPEGNLSRALQWVNVSYAAYYNRRRRLAGHLFRSFPPVDLIGPQIVTSWPVAPPARYSPAFFLTASSSF
ncbi:MAG TPA: hypothetical protein ENI81_02120 [Phycisphaerales bacterium]|nr:hypothetical protein [Phycisphaerales bacterium]